MPITLDDVLAEPKPKKRGITLEDVLAEPDSAAPSFMPEPLNYAVKPSSTRVTPSGEEQLPFSEIPARMLETVARQAPKVFGGGEEFEGELPGIAKKGLDLVRAVSAVSPLGLADIAADPVEAVKGLGRSAVELAKFAQLPTSPVSEFPRIVEELKERPFTKTLELATPVALAAGVAKAIPKAKPKTIARSFEELAQPEIRAQIATREAPAEAGATTPVQAPKLEAPSPPLETAVKPVAPEAVARPAEAPKAVGLPKKRIRFNRGSVGDAVRAAKEAAGNEPLYVFATSRGMTIEKTPPPFGQQHIKVFPDKTHQVVGRGEAFTEARKAGIEPAKEILPKETTEIGEIGVELPPTIKTPLESAGGGLGFARGGKILVDASALADKPKVSVIRSQPKAHIWSNLNRVRDEFHRLSPELGKVIDDATVGEIEVNKRIARSLAEIDNAMSSLSSESKVKVRDAVEGKVKPETLSPLERQKFEATKQFNEKYRRIVIDEILRPPILRRLTNPSRRVLLDAVKQPTPEAAAEFVMNADWKSYGARKPFSETVSEAAQEYRSLNDWGIENYFHRLYEGNLRMEVIREGKPKLIGFAKDVTDAQRKFDDWIKAEGLSSDNPVELVLFEKRAIPEELALFLGKDGFKRWKAAVEGQNKQIRIKTSRAGFFAAINKAMKAGELDRDLAGEIVATAIFPRPAKGKPAPLKPRKLEGTVMGLAEPDKAMRALAYSIERKLFNDRIRSQVEPQLTKIQDQYTKKFVENTVDYITGRPTDLDLAVRNFMTEKGYDPMVAEKVLNGVAYYQVMTKLGLLNLRFPLVNKTQMLTTLWPVVGEKSGIAGSLKAKKSYIKGTPEYELWKESGLSNVASQIEGTNVPTVVRMAKGAAETVKDAAVYLVKKSESDNLRTAYFAFRDAAEGLGYKGKDVHEKAILGVVDTQFPRLRSADIPALRSKLISSTIGQFQSFNLSQLQFWRKVAQGKKVTEAQATSPMGARARALGGLLVSGGAKAVTSPFIRASLGTGLLLDVAYNIDQWYEDLKEEYGETVAKAVFFGLPAVAGADISGSLEPTIPFLSSRFDVGFPAKSTLKSAVKAIRTESVGPLMQEVPALREPDRDYYGRPIRGLSDIEKMMRRTGIKPTIISEQELKKEKERIKTRIKEVRREQRETD